MKPDKVLAMVGMAARAGAVVSGEFSTERAVKSGKAHLVIAAVDASENTKKHFSDMCAYRKVAYYEYAQKEQLGGCIGKEYRASLAITDGQLSQAVIKRLKEFEQRNHGGNQ